MRGRMGWVGVVVATTLGVGAAQACQVCTADLYCSAAPRGGLVCMGDGSFCAIAGRCAGLPMFEDPSLVDAVQLTLLEDAPGLASAGPARLVSAPFGVAVGRAAARLAARSAGAPGLEPGVVFGGTGVVQGAIAAFRSPTGDGFTLSRERDGRGARVEVCALAGGRPGRVLASERLDEREALVVRVPFDGRTRVLVVQAATLPEADGRARESEARRELGRSGPGRPAGGPPPYELRALDR